MTDRRDDDVTRLRASVRVLRGAVVLLALAAGALLLASWRTSRAGEEPSAYVVDVAERARGIVKEHGPDANEAAFFLQTPSLSVHLHLMGRRHHCPLHVHAGGHEATVIVDGQASVRQVFHRGDGGVEATTEVFAPGSLVGSPPGCAHAFTNVSSDDVLANLVFSSPGFDHNTYVPDEADDRIGVAPPTAYTFERELRAFAGASEERRRVPLAAMGGDAMALFLVRGSAELVPRASGVTVVYVLEGTGVLRAEGSLPAHAPTGRLDLGPKRLAVVRGAAPLTLSATPPSVLAAIVHAG